MHTHIGMHTYILTYVCVPRTQMENEKNIPRQLPMNTVCSHWEMFVVMLHWNITSKSF